MSLTSADETLVWLADEQTSEIQLRAYCGADEERIRQWLEEIRRRKEQRGPDQAEEPP